MSEILVIHDPSLVASKKQIVKIKFPNMDTFYHEVPAVISEMHNITFGVSKHLETISLMGVDKRIKYTERILRGPVLNKYRQVLAECN